MHFQPLKEIKINSKPSDNILRALIEDLFMFFVSIFEVGVKSACIKHAFCVFHKEKANFVIKTLKLLSSP